MNGRTFTVKTVLRDYFQGALGESKLRELVYRGEIPHIRIGNKIIFREESLDDWMSKQEKKNFKT